MKDTVYVLHSPYPDGTWRGWEKCATGSVLEASDTHGVLMFDDRDVAEQALADVVGLIGECGLVVWPIEILMPDIRSRP